MSKVLVIDFDGTIVEHCFPHIGDPLPGAFETLKELKEAGFKLILWTCREDSNRYINKQYLKHAVDFCLKNGVEFDAVNEAIQAEDFRDDDFNFGGFPGWHVVRQVLLEGHELNVEWIVQSKEWIMNVRSRILSIIARTYGIDVKEIKDTDFLEADLGGDSLDNYDLHFRLEKEFEIRIPDEDAEMFHTVSDVFDTVEFLLKPQIERQNA